MAGNAGGQVVHIVLVRWKPGASPGAIAAAIEGLKALKEKVPGILDIACGENFSARSQGFQCGLVVRFSDQAALDAYLPHPAHQDVVHNLLAPIRQDSLAVDFCVGC